MVPWPGCQCRRIHSPLLKSNQSPSGSGFSLPNVPQSRARRTAVDIFPEMEEFLTRLCTFGVNRSSPGTSKSKVSLSLSKAIDGFLKFKTAEGLSQRTITSYEFTLGHWLKYIGDREVSEIQSSDLTGYMAWLRTEYKPRRWNGSSWYTISDAQHTIQFEWKAASSASTHDGTLQLWIDGVSQQLVTKIDNDTVRLTSANLGVLEGVDSGTRGTEYFGDFNSWRSQAWTVGETISHTITYGYDPLYRLTLGSSSDGDLFQYTYDAVGNRLTETTIGGVTINYTYDNANRLTGVDGTTYTWDANGNLLSDGGATYTYNHSNQLTGVSQGGINYSYAFDGLGNRLRQTVGRTVTNYLLDTTSGLSQVLADGTNTYLYGLGRISQSNTDDKDYFLGDALGRLRQLANTSGAITLSRSFEPYGTIYGSVGNKTTSYGFTGEWADGNGMVNLRARYYNTSQGRFTSQVSWGGELSNLLIKDQAGFQPRRVRSLKPDCVADSGALAALSERSAAQGEIWLAGWLREHDTRGSRAVGQAAGG